MSGLTRRLNRALASVLPEKRLFLQSPHTTTYLRFTPIRQLGLGALALAAAGWLTIATANVAIGLLYADSEASRTVVLSEAYQARLDALAAERDQRAREAYSAQNRFQIAMQEIGRQQSDILAAVESGRELESALELMRARLEDAAAQRDAARAEVASLREQEVAASPASPAAGDLVATLEAVSAALSEAARVRDGALAERDQLAAARLALEAEVAELTVRQEAVLAELEYATRMALEPLTKVFETSGLDIDSMIAAVRRDYSGSGGTVSVSTRSYEPGASSRFDSLMVDLDRVNMLRIAASKIPYAMPVSDPHRFTSGFGFRRNPMGGGGRRMHEGIDLAAPSGTPIYATADGVVVSAGRESGYGNTVRIRHDFGFETVYAHKSRIRVKAGQRVSRGEHIGDMGTTGRSTGVHLHYEVHLNGEPMNPMVYLEAARDVF